MVTFEPSEAFCSIAELGVLFEAGKFQTMLLQPLFNFTDTTTKQMKASDTSVLEELDLYRPHELN